MPRRAAPRLRAQNLDTLRGWKLTDTQLALQGEHPALGTVTLRQLLSTWVAHDLGHLAQTARVMAKDEAFAVPTDAKGSAIDYGLLEIEPISAEHARHLVQDDGAKAPAARELRIVATGIQILD